MDVQNWISLGGSELGAIRHELTAGGDRPDRQTRSSSGTSAASSPSAASTPTNRSRSWSPRATDYRELRIPMICVPATIDNNLPGTETTIGADTALNNIVDAVDKIKYTAGAAHRAFIVEVMGRRCGYLGAGGRHRQRRGDGAAARGRHHPG